MIVHRVIARCRQTLEDVDLNREFENIQDAMDLIDDMYKDFDRDKVRIYVKTINKEI